ncbi:hypothetical protein [Xenorhabdus miraniensis]|nr:hypothetical protein [Xenorhabdus miraniensis]
MSIDTYKKHILPKLSYDTDEDRAIKCFELVTGLLDVTSSPESENVQQAPTPEYYEAAMSGLVPCSSNLLPPISPPHAPGRNARRQQLARRNPPSHNIPSYGSAPPSYGSPPAYGSPPPYEAPPSYESITQNPMGNRGGMPGPSNLPSTSGRGSARLPRGRNRGRK